MGHLWSYCTHMLIQEEVRALGLNADGSRKKEEIYDTDGMHERLEGE